MPDYRIAGCRYKRQRFHTPGSKAPVTEEAVQLRGRAARRYWVKKPEALLNQHFVLPPKKLK
jgi:hypothetical protein